MIRDPKKYKNCKNLLCHSHEKENKQDLQFCMHCAWVFEWWQEQVL